MKIIYLKISRLFIAVTLVFSFLSTTVMAETIAVIGTGSVSKALGPRFTEIGYDVIYGSRTPDSEAVRELVSLTPEKASAATPNEAVKTASIVLLAVPWDVAEEVVLGLGDLTGKIIIDPINPRVVDENNIANYPSHVSNAERIQALAPQAMVVKAFSTISADTMADPSLESFPFTIPLVGNDLEAKQKVAEICEELGFETLDFGAVHFAHIVEGLYLMRTNVRLTGDLIEWGYLPRTRPRR